MTLTHLTGKDYTTTRWSGGTTTELLIRPRGAAYGQRAFLCRISSATVELEESTFTALPDYTRLIATLEGTITLAHDGGEPLTLAPYTVHTWASETVSHGRCRDFNLMLRKGQATGSLRALQVTGTVACPLSPGAQTALLYCAEGHCTAAGVWLAPGESLLLEDVDGDALTLEAAPQARLMLAQVSCL